MSDCVKFGLQFCRPPSGQCWEAATSLWAGGQAACRTYATELDHAVIWPDAAVLLPAQRARRLDDPSGTRARSQTPLEQTGQLQPMIWREHVLCELTKPTTQLTRLTTQPTRLTTQLSWLTTRLTNYYAADMTHHTADKLLHRCHDSPHSWHDLLHSCHDSPHDKLLHSWHDSPHGWQITTQMTWLTTQLTRLTTQLP